MQQPHFGMLFCLSLSLISSGCQAKEAINSGDAFTVSSISLNEGEKSFSVGDFNNDEHIDLVVSEEAANRIVVFLNDGVGALKRSEHYPAGNNPTSLKRLDFDRNSNDDLVIANHETESITLLKGNGDGTFEQAVQSPIPIETEPHSHMIDVADFNSDGFADLIVDSRDRFGTFILLGQEDGSFNITGEGIDVGGTPYLGFAVADLNNDEAPDIITPNRDQIGILLNHGDDGLKFSKNIPIDFSSVFAVAAGDVTGDGHIDLVAASEDAEEGVALFSGDGQGNFKKLKSFPIAAGAKVIAMGDVNGDGLQDAVVTSWNSDALLIMGEANDPKGTKLSVDGLTNPWSVIFGDFDGDDLDEIVIGDATGTRVNIYTLTTAKE